MSKRSQRVGIWVIAIVMGVGSVGIYFVAVLANQNNAKDQQAQQQALADYQKQQQAADQPLDGYQTTTFDKSSVTDLKVETLVAGSGDATATANSTITANYFGWTSDGTIFDSTNKSGTTTPIDFSLAQVIKGWTQGLTGAKVGEVRRLTIPSDLAYGPSGSGTAIGPNEPLMFIVQVTAIKS